MNFDERGRKETIITIKKTSIIIIRVINVKKYILARWMVQRVDDKNMMG